ncbi:hypothetical protein FRC17_000357 [Serendipita sp. 399]|nr:hypothetical protein FRC17_000357 [Serendipita sp. 399]
MPEGGPAFASRPVRLGFLGRGRHSGVDPDGAGAGAGYANRVNFHDAHSSSPFRESPSDQYSVGSFVVGDEEEIEYEDSKPKHAAIYRAIRLSALATSPAQFSSTFAREVAFDPQVWVERLRNPDAVTILASEHDTEGSLEKYAARRAGEWASWDEPARFRRTSTEGEKGEMDGLITCLRSYEDPKDAFLVQFWVDPAARGRGIGTRLVEEALVWARYHNRDGHLSFRRVILDVVKDNMVARRVYERCGFKLEGDNPEDSAEMRYIYTL